MPLYNLLKYSGNYSMTSGSVWIYFRNEIIDSAIENNDDGHKINNNKTITSKSFKCRTKIIGTTPDDNNLLNVEVVVPLKYWNNLWIF